MRFLADHNHISVTVGARRAENDLTDYLNPPLQPGKRTPPPADVLRPPSLRQCAGSVATSYILRWGPTTGF